MEIRKQIQLKVDFQKTVPGCKITFTNYAARLGDSWGKKAWAILDRVPAWYARGLKQVGWGTWLGNPLSLSPAHPFTQQARHLQTITVVNKTSDFGQCALQHVCMMVKIQAWVIFTRRRKGQLLIDPCLGSSAQNVLKNMCQNMCLNADKRGGQILFGQCQNKHDFPQVAPQSSLKSRPPGPILLLLAPAHTGSYTLLLGVQRIIVQH